MKSEETGHEVVHRYIYDTYQQALLVEGLQEADIAASSTLRLAAEHCLRLSRVSSQGASWLKSFARSNVTFHGL